MSEHKKKIIGDWILATRDTIYELQNWLDLLNRWQRTGQVERSEFEAACQQLREMNMWGWAREAGGHGIEALAVVMEQDD